MEMQDMEMQVERTPPSFWRAMWKVYFHPSMESFEHSLVGASFGRALAWLTAFAFVVSSLLTLGSFLGFRSPAFVEFWRTVPPDFRRAVMPWLHPRGGLEWLKVIAAMAILAFLLAVLTILGTMFNAAISHLAAQLLDGDAPFAQTFFVIVLVSIPAGGITMLLELLSSLFQMVTLWGSFVSLIISGITFLLSLYVIVLEGIGLAAAHGFTVGKGLVASLAPVILGILLSCCFYAFLLFGAFFFLPTF